MELVAPAGSVEKLRTAYDFGADAAYIGISGFSLRAHAETDDPVHLGVTEARNAGRRLYGALNALLFDADLLRLPPTLERLSDYDLDGIIVSDIGVVEVVRRYLPRVELHLSTQANCTNAAAVRVYRDLGFSRIVPARELSIDQIGAIRAAVPEVELEVFVHGAMCMAYSGRCFLSSHLASRSANRGDCAHPCRWKFALSEEKRPGEYFPVEENDGGTTILSSRDLMAIDLLPDLQAAGVDAVKIEGRMKSAYYVAIATRTYRAHIDALRGRPVPPEELAEYRNELHHLSNRGYTTGFLKENATVHAPSSGVDTQRYRLLAIVTGRRAPGVYTLETKNRIDAGASIDLVRPGMATIRGVAATVLDAGGQIVSRAVHGGSFCLRTKAELPAGTLVRGAWYTSKR